MDWFYLCAFWVLVYLLYRLLFEICFDKKKIFDHYMDLFMGLTIVIKSNSVDRLTKKSLTLKLTLVGFQVGKKKNIDLMKLDWLEWVIMT